MSHKGTKEGDWVDKRVDSLITSLSHTFIYIGMLSLGILRDSDDSLLEGLDQIKEEDPLEDIVETNSSNIETVLKNQRRVYHTAKNERREMRSLFYRGFGVLVTLMVALMGMVGGVLVTLI